MSEHAQPVNVHIHGEKKGFFSRLIGSLVTGFIARSVLGAVMGGWVPYLLAGILALFGWKVMAPEAVKDAVKNTVKEAKAAAIGIAHNAGDKLEGKMEVVKETFPETTEVLFKREGLPTIKEPSLIERILPTRIKPNGMCPYCETKFLVATALNDMKVRCGNCGANSLGGLMVNRLSATEMAYPLPLDIPVPDRTPGAFTLTPLDRETGTAIEILDRQENAPEIKRASLATQEGELALRHGYDKGHARKVRDDRNRGVPDDNFYMRKFEYLFGEIPRERFHRDCPPCDRNCAALGAINEFRSQHPDVFKVPELDEAMERR